VNAKMQGSAKNNLRMMAKILACQIKQRPIYANEFLRHAKRISDLSFEEIAFLATYIKYTKQAEISPNADESVQKTWDRTAAELVPQYFSSEREMRAVAYGLQRTGLVMAEPAIDSTGYLVLSPLAFEIEKLCSFESAFVDV